LRKALSPSVESTILSSPTCLLYYASYAYPTLYLSTYNVIVVCSPLSVTSYFVYFTFFFFSFFYSRYSLDVLILNIAPLSVSFRLLLLKFFFSCANLRRQVFSACAEAKQRPPYTRANCCSTYILCVLKIHVHLPSLFLSFPTLTLGRF